MSFSRGTGSSASGFTSSMILLLTTGAPYSACSAPRLSIRFNPPYEGDVQASGTLRLEEEDVELEGTVVVEDFDEFGTGRLRGTAQLEGGGWTVSGDIDLMACPDLARTSL